MKGKHEQNPRAQIMRSDRTINAQVGAIKRLWSASGRKLTLKAFARTLLERGVGDDCATARRWFYNKRVNAAKAPLRIGNTRKKKGSSSTSQKPVKVKTRGA